MRKLLIATPIVLVSVALVAPGAAGGEHDDPTLDPIHMTRPAAAALESHHQALVEFYEAVEQAKIDRFLAAAAAAAEAEAEAEARAAEARAAQAAPASQRGVSSGTSGGGHTGWMECTKGIESNGDYGAVSPGGTYRGAYQFHQDTWNRTVASAGRGDLVGLDPASASPADQDAMALHLFDGGSGASHWGGRCM